MTKKDEAKAEAKRIVDYSGTSTIYEGELIPMADLEDKELTVLAFNFADSSYRVGEKFLSMQCELDGEKIMVNTNAKVPMKGFLNVPKEELPMKVTFFMEKPKGGGKPYWNMR